MVTILCKKDGSWKKQLEKQLETNPLEPVTLLALGKVKMDILTYLNQREDLQITKIETRYMKKRGKGLGLKIQVAKVDKTN